MKVDKIKNIVYIYKSCDFKTKRNINWAFMWLWKDEQPIIKAANRAANVFSNKKSTGEHIIKAGALEEIEYLIRNEVYHEDVPYPGFFFKIPSRIDDTPVHGDLKLNRLTEIYKNADYYEQIKLQWSILKHFYKRYDIDSIYSARTAAKAVIKILTGEMTVSRFLKREIYETNNLTHESETQPNTNE